MPPQTLSLVLHSAMGMCGLMAVLNAMRYKQRGAGAYALAAAFVALGFTIWLYSKNTPIVWVEVGLAATVVLLIVEFGIRASKLPRQGPDR